MNAFSHTAMVLGRHFEHATVLEYGGWLFFMPGALRLRWGVLQSGLHKETGNQDSASCPAIFIYKTDLVLHLFSGDEAPGH